jgi:hypothetical protein
MLIARLICDIKLHNLYRSPNTVRVINSRRIGWAGNIALFGETRIAHNNFVGKPKKTFGRPSPTLTLR